MTETRRLKNVVIFFQTILGFVLSRKIVNIYNDIARKYKNGIIKHVKVNVKIVASAKKIIVGILAHVFVGMLSI